MSAMEFMCVWAFGEAPISSKEELLYCISASTIFRKAQKKVSGE